MSELEATVATLEQRLEDGDRRIREAEANRKNVQEWEDFWIDLLHEYEDACDRMQAARQRMSQQRMEV